MSAEPSLFDVGAAPRVVDASALGTICEIVVTESGADLMCTSGTLRLSVEQYLAFVRYRKVANT